MSHEPKLTVYTIRIKPVNNKIEDSIRCLCKNKLGKTEEEMQDSELFLDLFSKVIKDLDKPEMYSDEKTRKCMTANQANIEDDNVNANIFVHSDQFIIEGKLEGGTFGKKRNKTSIVDKSIKSNVNEKDAITDDFYFFIYIPLNSNLITLFIHSYTDDAIDSVMKIFWEKFFTINNLFKKPQIKRFVPHSIVQDFKKEATVSSLQFTTRIPGTTLLENTQTITDRNYIITVHIKPIKKELTYEEYEKAIEPIQESYFNRLKLGDFKSKKGELKNTSTNRTTKFDLGTSFEVQPVIQLSKFISINNDESDFGRIKDFCFKLLEEIKSEIYPIHAVRER